jgi:hypothetical protein
MSQTIVLQNGHHLGDNIINFIFFYKIKDYIEANNIIIHYYCLEKYHNNLADFNCSKNIIIMKWENKGYILWQGGNTPHQHWIEDKLCGMFNIFLNHYKIPISVNSFEYQDPELFARYENLDNKYKNIDILIINSTPLSCQYNYNKEIWNDFIIRLSGKYLVAVSETVNDSILSLHDVSVKNIAAIALKVKKIIAINTGPSIPLYNTDILNNVDVIYLFGGSNIFKTRKIKCLTYLKELSFLLY